MLAGGEPSRCRPRSVRFQDGGRRAGPGDHSENQMVLFNSPSNPTGAAYARAELEKLTDVLVGIPCWMS